MISYLLKSGLCLAILLAFYHLILEREKMHQFNRFYLLGSIVFSFVAPLYIIYIEAAPAAIVSLGEEVIFPSTLEASEPLVALEQPIDYISYLLYLYYAVSGVFLIRFFRGLFHMYRKITLHPIIPYQKAKIILLNEAILPYTFWNYIFINKEDYESKKVEKELFTHELTHVTQRHTIDILLMEVLQILFWFNPIFFVLKKAIQLNHEFLADDNVISAHKNISEYQFLLLNKAAWNNKYYLASNLNYSLTKKRLLMMKTSNSKATILLKKLAIIPLITGLVFLFANRIEAQTDHKEPVVIGLQEAAASKAQMKEYRSLMAVDQKSNATISKLQELHSIMSEEQRAKVTSINVFLPQYDKKKKSFSHTVKRNSISKSLFEKLKNEKKYVVWLDGKRISNQKLNQYSYKDIVSYQGSYVTKETRDKSRKDLAKEYHYILRTERQFKKVNTLLFKKDTIPPPPPPRKIAIKGVSKSQMKVYKSFIQRVESSQIIKQTELVKMADVYQSMSIAQKKTVKDINKIIPPFPVLTKKPISKALFEKIKNSEKYSVRIDRKVVSKAELSKYKPSDFVSYLGSFVHKNARSKKFPQEYQYTLYTQPFFKRITNSIPPPPVVKGQKVAKVRVVPGKRTPPPPPRLKKGVRPVKIEVVPGKRTPPPPPKKKKSKTQKKKDNDAKNEKKLVKVREVKPSKKKRVTVREVKNSPKVIEVKEILEQGSEVVETIEETVSPEVEEVYETEIQEAEEIAEVYEDEAPTLVEILEITDRNEIKEITNLFDIKLLDTYNSKGKRKAHYYYRGKKISVKKAAKILAKHLREKKKN